MNFDQKAVKFLANFYIDGGKHWTHGPLRQETLMPLRPEAVWWGPCPWAGGKVRPPAVQEFPEGLRVNLGSLPESWRVCTGDWDRKQLWLEQHPPIPVALDYPGPATYRVPDASVRESSPHPHFSIGRKRPIPEAAGRGAWQTVWIQSERPFSEKDPLRPPGERRPSPTAYDIAPGRRLQSLRPPAFSMSRSPASASWVHASRSPGPAAYHVEDCYNSRFPTAPGVLIQGVRRPKRHETGPFCSL
ncbi:unnamed protein product [Pipistrellus nathusii]|uniref:Sperm-tail PG-rich repeat containing 3 n=1 Tax=Pipistrellus nathusii TaxID=59473 RepID=A0ABN9Z521_PIPNA